MDEKKFENNAELFFDVTNLFNNSIPIKLKKENYPDKIGDYSKEQVTVENVYYIKK